MARLGPYRPLGRGLLTGELAGSDTDLQLIEQAAPRADWAGDRTSFAVPVTTRTSA